MDNIKELSIIIQNYRRDELPIHLDEKHILKWLNQFDDYAKDEILSELVYIFRHWYFNSQSIIKFGNEVIKFLSKTNDLNDVFLYNDQLQGKSQNKIVELLCQNITDAKSMSNNKNSTHFVYLDDGLYTGSHIRNDIKNIVEKCNVSQIDVFVLIAYSDGFEYTKKCLEKLGNEHNIAITLHRFKELQNIKRIEVTPGTESYFNEQDILWPQKDIFSINEHIVNEYTDMFDTKSYLFRSYSRLYTSKVFSSEKARKTLEKQFLIKGIEIIKNTHSDSKGLYPLGYNNLGSICAFDYNISNTCPLVLWWGNIKKQGNSLDNWYPLLPRRTK